VRVLLDDALKTVGFRIIGILGVCRHAQVRIVVVDFVLTLVLGRRDYEIDLLIFLAREALHLLSFIRIEKPV
jgi:hypothetical protein